MALANDGSKKRGTIKSKSGNGTAALSSTKPNKPAKGLGRETVIKKSKQVNIKAVKLVIDLEGGGKAIIEGFLALKMIKKIANDFGIDLIEDKVYHVATHCTGRKQQDMFDKLPKGVAVVNFPSATL